MSAPLPTLRVLSLWQPWATLCVAPDPHRMGYPPKQFETRSWFPARVATPFRVAIHATKTLTPGSRAALRDARIVQALLRCGYVADALPLGAIVGVATVAFIGRTELLSMALTDEERALGDYSPGRWAWELTDTVQLPEPIPLRGRREALWSLTLDESLRVLSLALEAQFWTKAGEF